VWPASAESSALADTDVLASVLLRLSHSLLRVWWWPLWARPRLLQPGRGGGDTYAGSTCGLCMTGSVRSAATCVSSCLGKLGTGTLAAATP